MNVVFLVVSSREMKGRRKSAWDWVGLSSSACHLVPPRTGMALSTNWEGEPESPSHLLPDSNVPDPVKLCCLFLGLVSSPKIGMFSKTAVHGEIQKENKTGSIIL